MENDHTLDIMDDTGMPNYYVGVMARDFDNNESVNLYNSNNVNL